MNKIRPLNPIFIICCLLVPWRFKNTYFEIDEENLFISRYFAKSNGSFYVKKDTIVLNKLVKYGFPNEFARKIQEPILIGKYGAYRSQEIQFELKDGTVVPWNVRPYTKNQIKDLSKKIYAKNNIKPEIKLQKAINF